MKSIVLVAAMVLAAIGNPGNALTATARQEGGPAASAQAVANFVGTWKGSVKETIGKDADPLGSGTMMLTLVSDGDAVRGSWSSVDDYGEFRSGTLTGTVRGAEMEFMLVNSASGINMRGSARFDGAKLAGSFNGVFPNPEKERVDGKFVLAQ